MKLLHRILNLIFPKQKVVPPSRNYSLPYHPLYYSDIETQALIKTRRQLWACAMCDTNAGKSKSVEVRFHELVIEFMTPQMIKGITKKFIDDYTCQNYWIVCEYMEMSFYELMHTGECKTQSIYTWVGEIRRKYDHIELARLYQN